VDQPSRKRAEYHEASLAIVRPHILILDPLRRFENWQHIKEIDAALDEGPMALALVPFKHSCETWTRLEPGVHPPLA
jgi:hypothetical protein